MKTASPWLPENIEPPVSSTDWAEWSLSTRNRIQKHSPISCLKNVQGFADEPDMESWDASNLDAVALRISVEPGDDYSDPGIRQALALAYHSYLLLDVLSQQQWISMIHRLLEYCEDSRKCKIWGRNVLRSEIPTVLVALYPDWQVTSALVPRIRTSLQEESELELDGEGLIHAKNWNQYASLLACWARTSWLILEYCENLKLPSSFDAQLQWAIRHLLLLSNSQGELRFTDRRQLSRPFVKKLLHIAGDAGDLRIAVDARLAQKKGHKGKSKGKRPAASLHSEWAQIAILRSGWSHKRRELAVRYHQNDFELELDACGRPLLHGSVTTRLNIDNVDLKPQGEWTEVCWQDDADACYLELEMEYDKGWRIQRQLCVCKDTAVVMIADAVLGKQHSEIRYDVHYPFVEPNDISQSDTDTRELVFDTEEFRGLIMPLALPEWRESSSMRIGGELLADEQLVYSMHSPNSKGLYAPLFFALGRRSADKPKTWRRLTVAERLAVESNDSASAFRVQLGGRQWLLYRSLTEAGNRTFMGQNYSTEFVFGEFRLDGKMREYVEIS